MDARSMFACLSAAFAFIGGALLAHLLLGGRRSRFRAAATSIGAHEGASGRLAWLLRNGVAPFAPLVGVLLAVPRVDLWLGSLAAALESLGYRSSPRAVGSVLLAACALAGFFGGLLSLSPVVGLALALCLAALVIAWAGGLCERRRDEMREAVPDTLRSMEVCFRSGLSLVQTMRQVGSEVAGPLGSLFTRGAQLLETGSSTHEALGVLRGRDSVEELVFVAVALDVQHQTGGSMERVLEAARDTVEGELDLLRSLRVQTAQAKLSARIVSVMPFVLIALFSLISEDFLAPFFTSPAGLALLAIALAMQFAGVVAVRRLLKVEVG